MLERTEPPSVENLTEARRAIEAMLLVSNDPTPVQLLAQLVELPVDLVQSMCRELAGEYEAERRGFQLVEVAGGWRYQTHPDTHAYVERFALEGIPNRLSSAALETLAIVAYKQPISRAQIGAIRGVNVDGVLRTLVQRGYVDEKGRDVGPGQATLFGTTSFFLEQLGLMSLDDLPPLGDFVPSVEVLEALENTLRVDPEPEITIVDDDKSDDGPDSGSEPNDGAAADSEAEVAVEPAEGPTGEEPVYEVPGDRSDRIIALETHPVRSSTPDDGPEPEPEPEPPVDREPDEPAKQLPVTPETTEFAGEPFATAGNGAEPVPGREQKGSAVEAAERERSPEPAHRAEPDALPSDELEVAADPKVEMTDGPTETGAAGVDDARFPGPRSAPPPDPSVDLESGQGQDDCLDLREPSTLAGPGPANGTPFAWAPPPTPEALSNGHPVDPDHGDA